MDKATGRSSRIAPSYSILPKPVEPIRCQLSVACGMRDVLMSEVALDRSGIDALVR